MEGDAGQRARHLVERLLEVLLPEELGVGQPRADHLLVAGDDVRAAVVGRQVRHQQELVGQLARARMLEREALLVLLHGEHQAFGRHRQERLLEAAHQHQRPLGEAGVLGEQRLVLDQRQLVLLGQRARLLGDQRRAFRRIEDDLVRLEGLDVVGRARHLERLVAVEAMPARLLAGSRPPRWRTAPPCRRARRRSSAAAAPTAIIDCGPTSRRKSPQLNRIDLGHGKLGGDGRHHLADDLLRRPPRLLDLDDVEVALLVVLDDLRVLDRLEARRLDEAGDGLLRRIDARALALLAQVGRLGRHALHHQRQPPRRRVRPGLARREPLRLQPLGDQPPQILRRPRLHARRDLLGEQFQQQLSHGCSISR